jgi:PRC-barrel domain
MAHYGTLHNFRFSNEADDIRGATLYDAQNQKLGMIDDLIFDHQSGSVRYAIVDAGSWFRGRYFLIPASHIASRNEERNEYRVDLTREQIKRLPIYAESHLRDEETWRDYEETYGRALEAVIAALAETGPQYTLDQASQAAIDEPWTIEGDSRFNSQDLLAIGRDLDQRQKRSRIGGAAASESFLGARVGRRWSRFEDRIRDELDSITSTCTDCEELRRRRRREAA